VKRLRRWTQEVTHRTPAGMTVTERIEHERVVPVPMTRADRLDAYQGQNGTVVLTSAQRRRWRKKERRKHRRQRGSILGS
jgi:hypothetical protein